VKFIPPRKVRSNLPEKFAGAASSKWWTDRRKAVKQNAACQNTTTKISAAGRENRSQTYICFFSVDMFV
jgi:hypothetical protein